MLKDKLNSLNGNKELFYRKNSKKDDLEKILSNETNQTIIEEEEEKEKDDSSPEKIKSPSSINNKKIMNLVAC